MTEPLFFGEDLGTGSNKLYGSHGGIQLQAVVAADTGQQVSQLLGFRNRKPPMKVGVGGMNFYVGPGAHDWGRAIENLDYERMTGVPETRAIVYGILSRYMQLYEPVCQLKDPRGSPGLYVVAESSEERVRVCV